MSQTSRVEKKFFIKGMTCVNCEARIEKELRKLEGVENAKVSYRQEVAEVGFDASKLDPVRIVEAIESLGYGIADKGERRGLGRAAGLFITVLGLYLTLKHFGLLNFLYFFPEADATMGYGALFLVGLLTSVHCLGMCGGIGLSQCLGGCSDNACAGKTSGLRSSALYNAGRVVSYTVIGGIVGALGSVLSFSGSARGIVQLTAGVFMVIMGINMLGVLTFLRRFSVSMPEIFAQNRDGERRGRGPLIVGLLNGLMPCGPLQAMQLYALYTGNALEGALGMLVFSLGTVPLMFALGAFGTLLGKKFTVTMTRLGAVVVVVMGMVMFGNGMALSGFSFSAPSIQQAVTATTADAADVQVVSTTLSPYGYEAITVKAGAPVRWTIQAAPGTLNGCNNALVIPAYGIKKKLQIGDNVIEFTPAEAGVFGYSCWMGMIRSSITVVDGGSSAAAPQAGQVEVAKETTSEAPACCR